MLLWSKEFFSFCKNELLSKQFSFPNHCISLDWGIQHQFSTDRHSSRQIKIKLFQYCQSFWSIQKSDLTGIFPPLPSRKKYFHLINIYFQLFLYKSLISDVPTFCILSNFSLKRFNSLNIFENFGSTVSHPATLLDL